MEVTQIDVFKEEHRKYKRELAKAEAAFKEHQVDQHSGPLFEKEEEMEKGVNPLL